MVCKKESELCECREATQWNDKWEINPEKGKIFKKLSCLVKDTKDTVQLIFKAINSPLSNTHKKTGSKKFSGKLL